MKVKLDDIIEAIEMMDEYSEGFLDKETGEIDVINEMYMDRQEQDEIYDRLDEHGFFRLPTQSELRDYDCMEEFIYDQPEQLRDRLFTAIQGRGAFRRFKDTVIDMGIDKDWYTFRDNSHKRKAARWCEENGIEYEEN